MIVNRLGRDYLWVVSGVGLGEAITSVGGNLLDELIQGKQYGMSHEITAVDEDSQRLFEMDLRPLSWGSEGPAGRCCCGR